jgi:radical SAM superfamily enzyme YgiQ (UPF0313 family)
MGRMAPSTEVLIIDPATTEFNRGSFCYLPSILYSALKERKEGEVTLKQDATSSVIDWVNESGVDEVFVALTTYPQIDMALLLNRFIYPVYNLKFFGYEPLIRHLKLPLHHVPDDVIKEGVTAMPLYYDEMEKALLSDCDMHLSRYKGKVYPLFTSYGCPRNCSFCPSSVNCNRKLLKPSLMKVAHALNRCNVMGYTNIHFTDEDFFLDTDRAKEILDYIAGMNLKGQWNLIALGHVETVMKFLDRYGTVPLLKAGMRLIEVGLESANEDIAKEMGKAAPSKCVELAERMKGSTIDIFWLTMTFFPGDTIRSIRETGEFLEKYGHEPSLLYKRIRTNSTKGGLGQFFQPYHGAPGYENLKEKGITISARPIRLTPSFIPYSFLNDRINRVERNIHAADKKWFEMYHLPKTTEYLDTGRVGDILVRMAEIYGWRIDTAAVYLALCARLGVISE